MIEMPTPHHATLESTEPVNESNDAKTRHDMIDTIPKRYFMCKLRIWKMEIRKYSLTIFDFNKGAVYEIE